MADTLKKLSDTTTKMAEYAKKRNAAEKELAAKTKRVDELEEKLKKVKRVGKIIVKT